MLSFKDFTPVQYTGGETEMQDRYAFKRHHGIVGEAEDAEKASTPGPKTKISVTRPIGHKIADIGPGGTEHNVQTKDWPERTSSETISKIRGRIKENRERRAKHKEQNRDTVKENAGAVSWSNEKPHAQAASWSMHARHDSTFANHSRAAEAHTAAAKYYAEKSKKNPADKENADFLQAHHDAAGEYHRKMAAHHLENGSA